LKPNPIEIVDLAPKSDTDQGFAGYLEDICQRMGFDHAAYASTSPLSGKLFGFTTYSDAWRDHYTENAMHLIDPTLHSAARSVAPVDWGRIEKTDAFIEVFSQARDFNIPDTGLTVPIRGPYGETGLFSVTSSLSKPEWHKLKRHFIAELQLAAVTLHDRVMKSDHLLDVLRYPALSMRELEILQWVASGKTQQDIGDILSISPRTVEVHLRSSREKLNAISTPQAVGRAISMGLISPA